MKTLIIALTFFFGLGSVVSAQTTAAAAKKEVQKTTYTCPMHPKEISDKKGKCSKCGMDLVVAKESQTTTTIKSKYVCTMDGATADKPGKCPKCGMALTERKSDKK
jgi:transcription initiation factor IIE alpha subunit